MKQQLTTGIILRRTNYGEADRIVTFLTPDHGKLRLLARGVRKVKSKLAGGIELFSVSQISFMTGRGDVGTLVSTRLQTHYAQIVSNLDRVQLGYDLLKLLDKVTEDEPEAGYFELLEQAFMALNNADIDLELIRLWFIAQLLRLGGHSPNLSTDTSGEKLAADQKYSFDFDRMTFAPGTAARFKADHIKLLRLLFAGHSPQQINQVQGIADLLKAIKPLVTSMQTAHLRI